jgi:hypothetical protein
MSNQHLTIVRGLRDIKGPARAVLTVLADRANESGTAWPSWRTLQRESGFCRSAVHDALRSLRTAGLVSWTQRRDEFGDLTSNIYRLTLPSPGDGLGSPPDGLGSQRDGLGVVHQADGGSPGDGRRSIIEATNGSHKEASLFGDDVLPPNDSIHSRKEHLQELAESIYSEYPRKVAKKNGIQAILKAINKNEPGFLLERTKAFATAIGWKEKQYIPHPATWFNEERFNDDPSEWSQSAKQSNANQPTVKTTLRPSNIEDQ